MKKLLIIFFIAGFIKAQELTKQDSILIKDFEQQIKVYDEYQTQLLQKLVTIPEFRELQATEAIKIYLINRKLFIENKKKKND